MPVIHPRKKTENNIPPFGQIALAKGFVTADHLKKALTEQINIDFSDKSMPRRRIGEILFEKKWIRNKDIDVILSEQKKNGLHDEVPEEISPERKMDIARSAGIIIPGMTRKDVRKIFGSLPSRVWHTPLGQEVWFFNEPHKKNIYFVDDTVEKIKNIQ
jgi:hypothetical protein